jgi:nitroreductase
MHRGQVVSLSESIALRAAKVGHQLGLPLADSDILATAPGLGIVPIGAFDDQKVTTLLNLPKGESPLYIIPVGRS